MDNLSRNNSGVTSQLTDDTLIELKALSADTSSIAESFRNISIKLTALTASREAPSQFVIEAGPLNATWDRLYTEYRSIIWKSREVAGDASHRVQDFANAFIDRTLKPMPVGAIMGALQMYETSLRNGQKKAENMLKVFDELQSDILAFCERWSKTIQRYNLYTSGGHYRTYTEEISSLNKAIKVMEIKMVALCLITALLATASAVSAVILIFHGNLDALGLSASAASASMSLAKKVKKLLRERKSKLDEVSRLRSQLNSERCCNDLREIQNVASKLSSITSVWNCMLSDVHAMKCEVQKGLVTQDIQSWRESFNGRLEKKAKNYRDLGRLFSNYQISID